MPQIFRALQQNFSEGGEGVQEQQVRNDSGDNAATEVNLLQEKSHDSEWTLVIRRSKKPLNWNRKQKQNFARSGDCYSFNDYINYQTHGHNVPVNTPVLPEEDADPAEDDDYPDLEDDDDLDDTDESEEERSPTPPPPPPPPPQPPQPLPPTTRRSTAFEIPITPPTGRGRARHSSQPTGASSTAEAVDNPFAPLRRTVLRSPQPPSSTGQAFDQLLVGHHTRSRGATPDVPLPKTLPERKKKDKK
jgi:hypothetical protein